MLLDQAGSATIAYDSHYRLYAIKKVPKNVGHTTKVQLFNDVPAVVGIHEIFNRGDESLIVYECMEVSLRNVLATPRGSLSV